MMAAETAPAATLAYDIVVNGGSFSSPSAAFAAARVNPDAKVLLLEPTDWLGGQSTSQGVSAIDNAWHDPGASLMRTQPALYYPADYLGWLNRMRNNPAGMPGTGLSPNGTCWVSRESFDPRSGAWALDQIAAEFPNITVMKMTVVKQVQTTTATDEFGQGRTITGLTLIQRTPVPGYAPHTKLLSEEMPDWYSASDSADFTKQTHTVVPRDAGRGLVVIDASETGDVIVLSGADYTVGREKTTEYLNEDGTMPAVDEHGSQATVFTFCMTGRSTPDPETAVKAPWPDLDTWYTQQLSSYFSMGSHTWLSIWTYRRLLATGPTSSANMGDVTMQNWYPGNDYPYGSIYLDRADSAAQAADWRGGLDMTHVAQSEKHAIAWYFYMKQFRTSAFDTKYLYGSDPMNMMGTGWGLSKFPYIRCCRRVIGVDNFRLLGRSLVNTAASSYKGGTSFRFFDSVGIGSYAVDVHPTKTSTGISPPFERAAPFYIPYRSLGSANVRNLLVGGKQIAGTYITNAAYRLHPIEWAIGSAAGSAAALMMRDGRSNYGMLDTAPLRELQETVRQNSPIHWAAYDTTAIPRNNGDLVVNDHRQVQDAVPFRVEVYHFRAVRAKVYADANLLGETTTRANGRLLLTGCLAPASTNVFTALCYDAAGNLLDTLRIPADFDPLVVDNSDVRFSTSGTWTTGTSQPNKYGSSYVYAWGYDPPSQATWSLSAPEPGDYDVFVWYPEASNRATDAPFAVTDANGTTEIRVNQQVNGGQWVLLGRFRLNGLPSEKVVLSNAVSDTSKLVVADAVRIEHVPSDVPEWAGY